jgi:uncharacterized protein
VRFWDSSALVPLVMEQGVSNQMLKVSAGDSRKSYWWGSRVECASALARLEREGADPGKIEAAFRNMEGILAAGGEVMPSESIRTNAIRILRMHPLRAGDALQLAAAFHASEGHPPSLDFVCLDARLSLAASKEGFRILP